MTTNSAASTTPRAAARGRSAAVTSALARRSPRDTRRVAGPRPAASRQGRHRAGDVAVLAGRGVDRGQQRGAARGPARHEAPIAVAVPPQEPAAASRRPRQLRRAAERRAPSSSRSVTPPRAETTTTSGPRMAPDEGGGAADGRRVGHRRARRTSRPAAAPPSESPSPRSPPETRNPEVALGGLASISLTFRLDRCVPRVAARHGPHRDGGRRSRNDGAPSVRRDRHRTPG